MKQPARKTEPLTPFESWLSRFKPHRGMDNRDKLEAAFEAGVEHGRAQSDAIHAEVFERLLMAKDREIAELKSELTLASAPTPTQTTP
jgi:hypothetical protein